MRSAGSASGSPRSSRPTPTPPSPNGGVHHDATAIDRVVFPGGKVDEPGSNDGKRVLTAGQAYEVTKVLEGVIT